MTDCFQQMNLPPKAALDETVLQQRYAERSRVAHPDHGGTEKLAAELNAAYETLRLPELRLKHLMDLSAPEEAKTWRTVPLDEEMMSFFGRLGQTLQKTSAFLVRKGQAQSALAKALLARETLESRDELESLGMEVETLKGKLEASLPECDERLARGDEMAWRDVAFLQAKLAYAGRWQRQIREHLLLLSLD